MRKEAFRFQQVLNILIYILTAGLLGLAFYSVLMKYVDVPAVNQPINLAITNTQGNSIKSEDPTSIGLPPKDDQPKADTVVSEVPPSLTEEQFALLEEMYTALRDKENDRAGEVLKSWYELWRGQSENDWVDFSGQCYNGQTFSNEYTGTAMSSDGTTRFYYGPLKQGVPNGEGVRIALAEDWSNHITYFWLEGTWEDGVLVGNARIYMGWLPVDSNAEYVPHVEIQCIFDGTPDEVMKEASIFKQIAPDLGDGMPHVYQWSFSVEDGKLLESEWIFDGNKYSMESLNLYNSSNYARINIPVLGEESFQNPYPWGQPYRFAYRTIFNCGFFHFE